MNPDSPAPSGGGIRALRHSPADASAGGLRALRTPPECPPLKEEKKIIQTTLVLYHRDAFRKSAPEGIPGFSHPH